MIVCLGWGSLIWRPEDLPLVDKKPGAWRTDGPLLPVEFLRQSSDGCLTLVVNRDAPTSQVLWNELDVASLTEAIEALRQREGNARRSWIGRWPAEERFECASVVDNWARSNGFEGVVWTAIPPKFGGEDYRVPSQDEALQYLTGLRGDQRDLAERYVRMAPSQIRTPYRRAIENTLGWVCAG